jgi:hypothetical protein
MNVLSPFCGSVTCGSSPYIRPIEHALNRGQFHPFKAPHVPRPRNAATSNDLSIDNSHSQHRGGGIASLYILSACPVPVPRTTSVRRAALHPALQLPRFEITALRRQESESRTWTDSGTSRHLWHYLSAWYSLRKALLHTEDTKWRRLQTAKP